jgi:hypothetical protein
MTCYAVRAFGGCLGGSVPDNARLVVDTTQRIEPLDLCSAVLGSGGIWERSVWSDFEEQGVASDIGLTEPALVKFYLGTYLRAGERVFCLGQVNPPTIALVPEREIIALHKVVSQLASDDVSPPAVSDDEKLAFCLMADFRSAESISPINPTWTPFEKREAA